MTQTRSLKHFFSVSRSLRISVSTLTGHGYKMFIPFPFLTFLSQSQWPKSHFPRTKTRQSKFPFYPFTTVLIKLYWEVSYYCLCSRERSSQIFIQTSWEYSMFLSKCQIIWKVILVHYLLDLLKTACACLNDVLYGCADNNWPLLDFQSEPGREIFATLPRV